MSAGTLGFDRGALPHHSTTRAGYTSISSGTMHRLVTAIAADAFNVPLREVRAGLWEEYGQVSVQLTLPLVGELVADDGGTVFGGAAAARAVVVSRIEALAGTEVGRVNVRFNGIHVGDSGSARRVQ